MSVWGRAATQKLRFPTSDSYLGPLETWKGGHCSFPKGMRSLLGKLQKDKFDCTTQHLNVRTCQTNP